MGQLPQNVQNEVENSEVSQGGFRLLDEGWYEARLDEVQEANQGDKGPYVTWVFSDLASEADGVVSKGKQWHNTSFAAPGMIKAVLEAFGAEPDVDLLTLVGERCRLYLIQQVQQKGKNAGKLQNSISELLPLGTGGGSGSGSFDPKNDPPF